MFTLLIWFATLSTSHSFIPVGDLLDANDEKRELLNILDDQATLVWGTSRALWLALCHLAVLLSCPMLPLLTISQSWVLMLWALLTRETTNDNLCGANDEKRELLNILDDQATPVWGTSQALCLLYCTPVYLTVHCFMKLSILYVVSSSHIPPTSERHFAWWRWWKSLDTGISLTTQNWLCSEPPFEHCAIARSVLSYVEVSSRALLLISWLGFPILSTCLLPLCLGNLLGDDEILLSWTSSK